MGGYFELDASEREALTTERAEVLLAPVSAGVTSVKLSGKSFGDGSAAVAAAALARAAPTLRHINLADVIAGRPEDEAKRALTAMAEGLAGAKELVSIDLSDNALGAKGIRAIGGLLSGQSSLESLKLCNNGLAADAGALIAAALTEKQPTSLRLLHFHNNLLENAGANALAPIVESSPDLEDFRFTGLRVHHEGAVRISQALGTNASSLKRLNVADNNFGEKGAVALSLALAKTRVLEELILRDTALCDNGIIAIVEALQTASSKLRILDLSGNEMTGRSARAFKKLLKCMTSLEVLMIEDNELGNAGAAQVARGLSPDIHTSLTSIVAASSEIGSSGAIAITQVAAELPKLNNLNLNGNCIGSEAVANIQEILQDKLGSLSDNDEDEGGEGESSGDETDGEDEEEAEDKDYGREEKTNNEENSNNNLNSRFTISEGDFTQGRSNSDDTHATNNNAVDDLAEAVDSLSVSA